MKREKSFYRVLSIVLAAFMIIGVLAIPSSEANAAKKKSASYVTKIKAAKKSVTVKAKKSVSVKITVKGGKKANKKFTAKSNKSKIATAKVVGNKVKITGKKAGKAVITVTTKGKNSKKKKLSAKIKVTVKAAAKKTTPVKDTVVISSTSASVSSGETVELSLTSNGKDVTGDATWASSNAAVASVECKMNSSAKYVATVTGQKDGKANITATYNGKAYTCAVTVSGFVASRDLVKNFGMTERYVEFEIRKTGNQAEDEAEIQSLIDLGYTISEDKTTASKYQQCETATYTFKKLPKTLEEVKSIFDTNEKNWDVDSEKTGQPCWGGFNAMAATICTANIFDATPNPADPLASKSPVWDIFDYINGPAYDIAQVSRGTAASSMKSAYQTKGDHPYLCYFKGASSSNGYTPSQPYVLEMYKGPYFIEQKQTINGLRPRTYMILVSGAESLAKNGVGVEGFDTDIYIDVYKSTKESRWCSFDENFLHITANGMKELAQEF